MEMGRSPLGRSGVTAPRNRNAQVTPRASFFRSRTKSSGVTLCSAGAMCRRPVGSVCFVVAYDCQ
jgi:hypothetical protein